jgi:hypothetical protein
MSKNNKKKAKTHAHDAVLETLHGKWTQFIQPGEIAVIADNALLYVVTKNRGPSTVLASVSYGDDEKLVPEDVRVISVVGSLHLETMDGKCATVEMEFIPRTKP